MTAREKRQFVYAGLGALAFFGVLLWAKRKQAIPEIAPTSVIWEGR